MKKRLLSVLAAFALALAGVIGLASPASASTQTVGFQAGSFHCSNGVYDVVAVDVTGTSSAPNANGSWRGSNSVARVTINGIPAGGGNVNVTLTYRCKVWVGIWIPGYGEPAYGTRWVYGTPPQPTYTL